MSGWISLHRSLEDHWIWQENRVFSKAEAWIDILMMVNHSDNKIMFEGQLITVKRGDRITSIRALSEKWNWSRTKVNNFLELLQNENMIVKKSDSKKTLLTVVNYDLYQNEVLEKRHKKATEKPPKSHRNDTEKPLKDTNNNDNNELIMKNNENNDNNKSVGGVDYHNQDFSLIVNEWQKLGFGLITQRTTEQILDWLKVHDKDLIMHVIRYAHDNGAINQRYVQAVLKSAREKNVKTVADFEAEQQKRAATRKPFNGKPNNQVIQPKWFKGQKETEPSKEVPKETDTDISNMINQFRKGQTP